MSKLIKIFMGVGIVLAIGEVAFLVVTIYSLFTH